jgi:hypothetical protein
MSAIDGSTFSFTLNCDDSTKFATSSGGQQVYQLRYVMFYTDVPSGSVSKRYDPFTVTILQDCSEATISIADSDRTSSKAVYVSDTVALSVDGVSSVFTFTPSTCTTLNVLVQIYDDDSLMNWTSDPTNDMYKSLLTDGTNV